MTIDDFGPFDTVLDVGGNVGDFAELARAAWPDARITSFEPIPHLVTWNQRRAGGRWWVEPSAVSDRDGVATLHVCTNQPSASTMQAPGGLRRERFGIRDSFEHLEVRTVTLDGWCARQPLELERCLLKIDVEGHELAVLHGAEQVLSDVAVVLCEVNQSPDIFLGSPGPDVVDALLREYGLFFAGVLGTQLTPDGECVQADVAWTR